MNTSSWPGCLQWYITVLSTKKHSLSLWMRAGPCDWLWLIEYGRCDIVWILEPLGLTRSCSPSLVLLKTLDCNAVKKPRLVYWKVVSYMEENPANSPNKLSDVWVNPFWTIYLQSRHQRWCSRQKEGQRETPKLLLSFIILSVSFLPQVPPFGLTKWNKMMGDPGTLQHEAQLGK